MVRGVVGHHGQPAAQDPDPQARWSSGCTPALRFGAVPLDAISQREVGARVTSLTVRGLAPATVHKATRAVRQDDGGPPSTADAGAVALSNVALHPRSSTRRCATSTRPRSPAWPRLTRPGYQALGSSAPTAGCASASWQGCAQPRRSGRRHRECGRDGRGGRGPAAVRAAQGPAPAAAVDRAPSPGGRGAGAAPASTGPARTDPVNSAHRPAGHPE